MLNIQQIRDEGFKALTTRKFHPQDDTRTYGTFFEMFKKSSKQDQFLKLIWAHTVKWDGDPIELAKIAPDVCPIFKTPLDYGRGLNKVTNPNIDNYDGFFQPTVDHKVARSHGGKDEIDNYVIVSRKANQFKSDMGSKEELQLFCKGMMETYYNDI
jgi:hypothetical protein